MSVIADPAVVKFIETVSNGANAASDSIAGLFLRLVGRDGALEKTVEAQAAELKRVDKLARQPKLPRTPPPTLVETGIDMHGDPVRIEHRIRRPRGRPKGAKDRYQRPARRPGIVPPAPSSYLIDSGFDDLG